MGATAQQGHILRPSEYSLIIQCEHDFYVRVEGHPGGTPAVTVRISRFQFGSLLHLTPATFFFWGRCWGISYIRIRLIVSQIISSGLLMWRVRQVAAFPLSLPVCSRMGSLDCPPSNFYGRAEIHPACNLLPEVDYCVSSLCGGDDFNI